MLEEKPAASTILLVEDNEELLALMVRLLHGKYHILKAANGTEALEILAKQEVDLIVSDVMMPEMDGMELCRRVKTQFETCHIPFHLPIKQHSPHFQYSRLPHLQQKPHVL